MRPQSPHGVYPPRESAAQQPVAHPDERLLQHRHDMAATDRPHLAQQEHWRGPEYEAALIDRAAYEARPMPPPEHQQPRPLSNAPGPEAFAPGQPQDQRFEHHRSSSDVMLREDPTDPRGRAVKYLPPDPRLHPAPPAPYSPHDRAPAQRPPSAADPEQRHFPQDPIYPQPVPPGHNPRNSPFISHERRESYPLHPQQPPPLNAPQPVHTSMERARMEEMHHQSRSGQPQPYEAAPQPRHPSALHPEAGDPQLHQRHPSIGSPRAQHAPPIQHPGYPIDAHAPSAGERPTYLQQGHGADPHLLRHGLDGPRPEDIHNTRDSFSYPAPPHPRPPRESAPSREGMNTNDPRHQGPNPGLGHRRKESLQEGAMRLTADSNGFQSPELSGRPRSAAQVATQPISHGTGQMLKHAPQHAPRPMPDQFNRSSMTSPMEGVSRDGQHFAGRRGGPSVPPGYEPHHHRQMSDQDVRPFQQFPPGSVEEFEHQQRLQQLRQQQQQQQQFEQQRQQQQHQHQLQSDPQQYQSRHEHNVEHNDPRRQGVDPSMVAAADRDAHRIMGERAATSPVTNARGKEPETVQNLEAAVANALVNIQHEGRFQSPDATAHTNSSEAHKRPRFEPAEHGIDSHPDNPHRRPYSREDEQETAIILQDMMNHRQERLSNEGTVQHSAARGHQRSSPEFSAGPYSEHRGPYQQYGGHPQGEHVPIDPRHPDDHPMPHGQRTQAPQLHAPHSQPQLIPLHGREGYVRPESFAFDPHQGMGPEDGDYTEKDFRQSRSSFSAGPPPHSGLVAAAEGNQWGANSPTHGIREMAEPPHHVHAYQMAPQQQPHSTTRGPPQWTEPPTVGHAHATMQHAYQQDMDMHHGSQTTKMEQDDATVGPSAGAMNKAKPKSRAKVKGVGKAANEIEASTDDVMNAVSEQAYDPRFPHQHRAPQEMSSVVIEESSMPKPRGGRSKVKTLSQSSTSSQPIHGQDIDNKEANGTYGPSHPSDTRSQRMDHFGEHTKVEGSYATTGGVSIETKAPESLLFGSGMILVKRLPDNSSNGNRPSSSSSSSSSSDGPREFPPPQLSIKTGQDHTIPSDGSTPVSVTPIAVTTPLSASSSIKKKRSRMLLDSADQDQDVRAGSPRLQTTVKNEPTTPAAGVSGAKGKAATTGAGRGRKGIVSGSTDADIERSNQITRTTGGPAWMVMGLSGSSTTLPNNGDGAGGSAVKGSNENLNNAGVRRRPPLPPSALLAENDKRKPKRIKIEVTDVRDGQRTLSAAADPSVDKQDGEAATGGTVRFGAEKGNGKRGGGAADPDNERENEDGEDEEEDEGEDEVMDEGGRSGSAGARKRRSPQDDDDDPGHGDATGNGTASRGQGRGSTGSLRKNMKRKSASTLGDASASNKRTKEKSKGAASSDSKGQGDSDESTGAASRDGRSRGSRVRKNNKSSKVEDASALAVASAPGAAAAAAADTESEIDYLPMEDDISCPHMFGIEDTDKEKESSDEEDEVDDDDEASKEEGEYRAGGGGLAISQKVIDSNGLVVTNGSKTDEAPDMQDPLQIQGREWVKKLAMPETAWEETFKTYERVKRLKELKNRQPVRKRDAILAAILYIVCRDQGSPRTFSEVCLASGVRRGDIGAYYRLMLRILEPSENATASARDTDAEAFMIRWCESLSLPPQVRQAAVHVFSLANTMNLTSGKCPSSVGAAAIYLCIFSWNDARRMARCQLNNCTGCQIPFAHPGAEHDPGWIRKEHKDVAAAVGVVSATLMGCFRNLAPEREKLVPEEFLRVAAKGVE
ncbi:Transcription initiation factor IIB [Mortierella alpina]|nr:Transcription initiation factor IIB [Mortierella alpina]